MNRETKRLMERSGADRPGAPARRTVATPTSTERVGVKQYFSEVGAELRKVAWPTKPEVINSSSVVLIALVIMMVLVFFLDLGASKLVVFMFGD